MNTQRLSMLSLMLVAAAGWTPSGLDAAANAAAPQSLAAIPLVFDTWVLDRARRMANHRANARRETSFACVSCLSPTACVARATSHLRQMAGS